MIAPSLIQGKCNNTYIVEIESAKYIYRQNRLFESNSNTAVICNEAHFRGIAPYIYTQTPNETLMQYIGGIHKNKLDKTDAISLANALKQLHSIPIQKSYSILSHLKNQSTKLKELLSKAKQYSSNMAICHNDLNQNNVLWQEDRVYLIDFDFAGVNDIYFDIAGVILEFELDAKTKNIFLEAYFNDLSYDIPKLELYIQIYSEFWKQWRDELSLRC